MPLRIALCHIQDIDESSAAFARQLGVTSVNITTPAIPCENGYLAVEDLVALRQRCADLGLILEAIENIPHHLQNEILMGTPGRDRQLDHYCTSIRNMAAAGILVHGFHFMPTGVWRTDVASPGRGGYRATAFDIWAAPAGNKMTWPAESGRPTLTADQVWENYRIFLDAVLPVAEEVGVTLAQHPDDPPVDSINGFARVFTSLDNLKKAEAMTNGSPAWSLDLCLGTVSEMEGGAATVHEVIDYFGRRGRIRYVHFRDVIGTVPAFRECFLGEGNFDPAAVLQHLQDVGFTGWLQDDHVPQIEGDTGYGHRARANAIGYLQGMLAAINSPGRGTPG